MTRLRNDSRLVTHTLRPQPEVSEAVERALARRGEGVSGLAEATQILDKLVADHPGDPRLRRLLGELRAEQPAGAPISVAAARRAFANLAEGAKLLQAAAKDTARVHSSDGARVSAFDRRMMQAVSKLCDKPLAEDNAPAATVFALDGKVLCVGVNRAYAPLHSWRRHGEMEALAALSERTFTGMALVLDLYRQQGGALDAATAQLLDRLKQQGLADPGFVDSAASLRAGGFFAPPIIAGYARDLAAFVDEGGFRREDDGDLHPHHRQMLKEALDEGLVQREDLADWAALDRLHRGDKDAKMDLYTSLEPCGMCMQNCTSEGHVGRVVYGAADPHGGGLSTLEHYADLYFDLGRVPYELVGGVEGRDVQARFDRWFREVYPRVRARSAAPAPTPTPG